MTKRLIIYFIYNICEKLRIYNFGKNEMSVLFIEMAPNVSSLIRIESKKLRNSFEQRSKFEAMWTVRD